MYVHPPALCGVLLDDSGGGVVLVFQGEGVQGGLANMRGGIEIVGGVSCNADDRMLMFFGRGSGGECGSVVVGAGAVLPTLSPVRGEGPRVRVGRVSWRF